MGTEITKTPSDNIAESLKVKSPLIGTFQTLLSRFISSVKPYQEMAGQQTFFCINYTLYQTIQQFFQAKGSQTVLSCVTKQVPIK